MRKFRYPLIFALCFGATVTVISWLLISPGSPVETSSISLKYFFATIQIFAAYAAMTLSGNPHLGVIGSVIYWALALAQWFVVGFGILFLFRLRHQNHA